MGHRRLPKWRRTGWEDPLKPGLNGLVSLAQRIEVSSPLALVLLWLSTNDFQSMHNYKCMALCTGDCSTYNCYRLAPIEPEMRVPEILVVAPPPIRIPSGAIAP